MFADQEGNWFATCQVFSTERKQPSAGSTECSACKVNCRLVIIACCSRTEISPCIGLRGKISLWLMLPCK